MVVDFDDFYPGNDRLDLLHRLKEANPAFCCTLFAVPGLGSPEFWESVPDWCELAVHGWLHPDPHEAEHWTRHKMEWVMAHAHERFVSGFKAPGWQISDGCYEALTQHGWWVADHYENDGRRPDGIRAHVLSPAASSGGDPNHWHGHIQDVCGNGMQETWPALLDRVRRAESFELISEIVVPWRVGVAA